ncbi:Bcr/CflA family efflux MFS transporter [Pseudonocardiaceae bacterium YIM PH 21723]|nr:Bcr/CflA family efflux MFS transporter [Pseudonocardiaceae bacterium YIM PH 21723]
MANVSDAVLETSPRHRQHLTLVFLLGGLTAFAPLSIDMYLPSLPRIAQDLHASTSAVQLTLTAYLVGMAAGQLVAGPWSDSIGRRKPIMFGLVVYTLSSLACAFAPGIGALVVLRLIQGASGSIGIVITRAIIRDLYVGKAAARFLTSMMLINGLAPIAAPLLGGQIVRFVSWHWVFLVLTFVGLTLLLACALLLPETLPTERRHTGGVGQALRAMRGCLTDRVFMAYAIGGACCFGAMFGYISGSPFVFQVGFGLSPQQFAVLFGVNALGIMAFGQLNRVLLHRFEPRRVLLTGVTITAAAGIGVLIALLIPGSGLLAVAVPLFFVVAPIGITSPNATVLAMAEYGHSAGSASALLGAIQMGIGGVVAPIVGAGGETNSLPMGIVIATLGCLAALCVAASRSGHRGTAGA